MLHGVGQVPPWGFELRFSLRVCCTVVEFWDIDTIKPSKQNFCKYKVIGESIMLLFFQRSHRMNNPTRHLFISRDFACYLALEGAKTGG